MKIKFNQLIISSKTSLWVKYRIFFTLYEYQIPNSMSPDTAITLIYTLCPPTPTHCPGGRGLLS